MYIRVNEQNRSIVAHLGIVCVGRHGSEHRRE